MRKTDAYFIEDEPRDRHAAGQALSYEWTKTNAPEASNVEFQ